MNSIWFTSDSHFGHSKIIEYEPIRSHFTNVEEMNEKLIENWNANIKPKDTVYHLGDFCFGRHNIQIASRLNGRKQLVLGNHDSYPTADYLKYFDRLYGAKFWEDCLLTHIPVHPSHSRVMLNVHGHLHSAKVQLRLSNLYELETNEGKKQMSMYSHDEDDPCYFNVSVEQNNLTPIHADIIRQRVQDL